MRYSTEKFFDVQEDELNGNGEPHFSCLLYISFFCPCYLTTKMPCGINDLKMHYNFVMSTFHFDF